MKHRAHEGGFILLDALVATVIVSLGGTALVVLTTNLLRQQDSRLDQAVALVMSQSLMKQFVLLGSPTSQQLEMEDELYRYEISRGVKSESTGSLLTVWNVLATPKQGTAGSAQRVDFLAPDGTVSRP